MDFLLRTIFLIVVTFGTGIISICLFIFIINLGENKKMDKQDLSRGKKMIVKKLVLPVLVILFIYGKAYTQNQDLTIFIQADTMYFTQASYQTNLIIDLDQLTDNPLIISGKRDSIKLGWYHNLKDMNGGPEILDRFDCYVAYIDSATQTEYDFLLIGSVDVSQDFRWGDIADTTIERQYTYPLSEIPYQRFIFGVTAVDAAGNMSTVCMSNYQDSMGQGFIFWKSDLDFIPPSSPFTQGMR